MKILKTTVNAPIRKLEAKWTLKIPHDQDHESKSSSPLTPVEEADLIIAKLKAPPKPKRDTLMDELYVYMEEEIDREISKEILGKLMKIAKKIIE